MKNITAKSIKTKKRSAKRNANGYIQILNMVIKRISPWVNSGRFFYEKIMFVYKKDEKNTSSRLPTTS